MQLFHLEWMASNSFCFWLGVETKCQTWPLHNDTTNNLQRIYKKRVVILSLFGVFVPNQCTFGHHYVGAILVPKAMQWPLPKSSSFKKCRHTISSSWGVLFQLHGGHLLLFIIKNWHITSDVMSCRRRWEDNKVIVEVCGRLACGRSLVFYKS